MKNPTLFRLLVVASVLFGMVTRSWGNPCSSVLRDMLPCQLEVGQASPYTGVLMTDSTARNLLEQLFLVKTLEIQLAAEEQERAADNAMNKSIIHQLKVKIEDAPLPFYESPWFWLGVAGAFGGGLALGLSLK